MKVVLLENVEHLGIIGDVKEVADGYARNYLLSKNLAVKFGNKEARIVIKDLAKKRESIRKEIVNTDKLAKELEGKKIEFEVKTTAKGKLFGAIGPEEVAKKFKLDKKLLQFAPIKDIGEHKVKIHLGHNIKTTILVLINPIANKSNKREEK